MTETMPEIIEETAAKLAEPRTLSADDKLYFKYLLENVKAAQAAINTWSGFASAKYKLGPTDRINEAGDIVPAPEGQ